ncbi:MAG: DUF1931 domain-containing protein [Candidatus Woesearchaeota archaeon]
MLIVKSKIKENVGDLNVSSDFATALDGTIKDLIEKAAARAKANGRKTVQARDL